MRRGRFLAIIGVGALILTAAALTAQRPGATAGRAPAAREKADPQIHWWAFIGPHASLQPCTIVRTRDELEEKLSALGWSVLQGHAGIAWRDGKFAAIVTGPPRTQLGRPLRVEPKGDTALIHLSESDVMNTRIFVVEIGPTPLYSNCEAAGR